MNAKQVKILAVQRALEAYAATLAEFNVPIEDITECSKHVRVAVLVNTETQKAVLIRSEFTFSTDPIEIEEAMSKKNIPSAGNA